MTRSRNLTAAVFLAGMSVILLELTLTRLFSVIMWYHFASLSVAVALLGFAVGAVVVHLKPAIVRVEGFPEGLAPPMALFSAAALVPFVLLGAARLKPQLLFPMMSFFHQPYYQPFRQAPAGPDAKVLISMAVLYACIILPFMAAGVFFAGLFVRAPGRLFGHLYSADLAGAAAGCLIFVPAIRILGAPSLLAATSALAAAAAGLIAGRPLRRRMMALIALAVMVLGILNGPSDRLVRLQFARGQYEPRIMFSRWNALSRVVVYPLSRWEAEQSWGISRRYPGPFPENLGILVDDAGFTPVIANGEGETRPPWAPYHVISLAYRLRPGAEALIIGPGGGRDILSAVGNGAGSVTAVELNPLVVRAVQEEFSAFSGRPYSLEGVNTVIGEGRSRMARSRNRYDVIQASSVFGEISPSAGAFSLSANHLYTREAFEEYWEHLKHDGILSFSRSVFGYRALRLVSLARDLLLRTGETHPEGSIAVLRERGLATVLVARGGFTADDVTTLRSLAVDLSLTIEALPGYDSNSRFSRLIGGEDVTEGRFDLSPPTDDRPFFYNNVPVRRFFNVLFRPRSPGERHIVVLRTMGIIFLVLVIFTLSLPFVLGKGRGGPGGAPTGRVAAYFAGIGLGYIVIELTMMHRLSLYLGNPTYALTVVLAALLMSSSMGSLWAGSRWEALRGKATWLPVALILLIFIVWKGMGHLSPGADLGLGPRIAIAAALLAPPGFVMGAFMPVGLTYLAEDAPPLIPWAWAVNGAASVLGSLGSLVLAMNFGFFSALTFGALSYALTVPLMRSLRTAGNDARKEVLS